MVSRRNNSQIRKIVLWNLITCEPCFEHTSSLQGTQAKNNCRQYEVQNIKDMVQGTTTCIRKLKQVKTKSWIQKSLKSSKKFFKKVSNKCWLDVSILRHENSLLKVMPKHFAAVSQKNTTYKIHNYGLVHYHGLHLLGNVCRLNCQSAAAFANRSSDAE